MITVSDVSSLFDINGLPPSAAQIADLRRRYARPEPFSDGSVSQNIAFFAPPFLDIAGSLIAAGVEASLPDPIGDLLADRPLASERNWKGAAATYVEAVRTMGRPLVSAEVELLTRHATVTDILDGTVSALKSVFFGSGEAK